MGWADGLAPRQVGDRAGQLRRRPIRGRVPADVEVRQVRDEHRARIELPVRV